MKKKNSLPNKLRWRLLLNFLMIILLMAIMNVSTISWTSTNYHKLSDELAYHLELHRISIDFIILEEALGSYISSGNQAYKDDVATSLSNIRLEMGFLQKESAYRSPLYYHLYDITNMVSSLTGQINRLYSDYSRGVSRIYIRDQMNSIERHVGYIESELAKVNTIYMDNLQQFYGSFSQTMLFVIRLSLAIILFLVLISILIASRFTNSISQPIHTLATTMLAFGRGDLDASIKPINNNDEISILIDSFNSMGSRIKRLVHSIQEKAKIERQLKLQEIEHQETLRLLRESELARLQSQINPHFLFNTLNTISAVAQIETAPQTNQLIYSLSTLLRYNLKNQNEMVMLEQEIVAVRSYMSIQQMRFGDKITYLEFIDPDTFGELVPSMLLQPLIENSIKHGLEPLARKGKVELHINELPEGVIRIIVRDDGRGIEQDVIDYLDSLSMFNTSGSVVASKELKQRRPLGMYNVMRRLELSYGETPIVVKRLHPEGTECTITLPLRRDDSSPTLSVDDTHAASDR
jgi:sensor histidine kinase YesM